MFDSLLDLLSPLPRQPYCAADRGGLPIAPSVVRPLPTSRPRVRIVWHNILGDNDAGFLSRVQLNQQVAYLNRAFSGLAEFSTSRVLTYRKPEWFRLPYQAAYQQIVRSTIQSPEYYCNVYCMGLPDYLGMAHFPQNAAAHPKLDAILLRWSCVPGGQAWKYSLGEVLVHEMGHWLLGLSHPFPNDNTCGDGDAVSDTPPCRASWDRVVRDCRGRRRKRSHMDYGEDRFPRDWTPGQIDLGLRNAAEYRANLFA